MGKAQASVALAAPCPTGQGSPLGGRWSLAANQSLQASGAAVVLDTVAWHGLGSRATEGLDQGLTAAAPAAGDRVASALRAPHHSGSFELASLPWFSCQLGPLQPGRTPAHPAIPCFGLQQEIGHGRSRSPWPQLGSGPGLRPRGLHPTERTAPALRGCLLVGRRRWYGFGLRRSNRVHPLGLLLAGPLRSRKALMWSDQRAEGRREPPML